MLFRRGTCTPMFILVLSTIAKEPKWASMGSMGKGRNRWGIGASLKKIQAPPKLGCLGGTWSASTQEESEDQKQFWNARTVRDGGRRKVQGVRGLFVGKEITLPLLGSDTPSSLAGRVQPATSVGGSGAARYSRQGAAGGSHKACPPRR